MVAAALGAVESDLAVSVEASSAQDATLLQEICIAAGDHCLSYQLALALALNDAQALSGTVVTSAQPRCSAVTDVRDCRNCSHMQC